MPLEHPEVVWLAADAQAAAGRLEDARQALKMAEAALAEVEGDAGEGWIASGQLPAGLQQAHRGLDEARSTLRVAELAARTIETRFQTALGAARAAWSQIALAEARRLIAELDHHLRAGQELYVELERLRKQVAYQVGTSPDWPGPLAAFAPNAGPMHWPYSHWRMILQRRGLLPEDDQQEVVRRLEGELVPVGGW